MELKILQLILIFDFFKGAVKGTSQLVKGIMSVPKSISAPMAGMWWSDIDGRWIETNLDIEAEHIMSWPPDDTDLLGEATTGGEPSKDIGNGTVGGLSRN